ncbi:DUF4278 domain-containing protein [Euhalothece natronophila Z-M001]|uniref:DUF4278 domain-containing protein n=1 Tax=Euhalothece natronophila Z-M001 TaxID=522448 RepID=A0A5B8NKK3_9CHRO|nr:DUF4278 domain-containing protein [Euhalothece natronophila]QDZ38880.1 DUF4278 domain-containing protein [Euhalothece natronophila Z-M001]
MKLTYRGTQYEKNAPVVETQPKEVVGRYRGLDWRFYGAKKPLYLQPRANLTYRGVTYQVHPTVANTPDVSVKPNAKLEPVETKAQSLMRNQVLKFKKRQKAMLSRATAEVKSH